MKQRGAQMRYRADTPVAVVRLVFLREHLLRSHFSPRFPTQILQAFLLCPTQTSRSTHVTPHCVVIRISARYDTVSILSSAS
jgi:hypothetical protein